MHHTSTSTFTEKPPHLRRYWCLFSVFTQRLLHLRRVSLLGSAFAEILNPPMLHVFGYPSAFAKYILYIYNIHSEKHYFYSIFKYFMLLRQFLTKLFVEILWINISNIILLNFHDFYCDFGYLKWENFCLWFGNFNWWFLLQIKLDFSWILHTQTPFLCRFIISYQFSVLRNSNFSSNVDHFPPKYNSFHAY